MKLQNRGFPRHDEICLLEIEDFTQMFASKHRCERSYLT